MEKLLVAHVERLFVVEARIEPSTFRPVSPTLFQLSYSACHQFILENVENREKKTRASVSVRLKNRKKT
jgi:hypothetical protein